VTISVAPGNGDPNILLIITSATVTTRMVKTAKAPITLRIWEAALEILLFFISNIPECKPLNTICLVFFNNRLVIHFKVNYQAIAII
jgi:hypothetical protein